MIYDLFLVQEIPNNWTKIFLNDLLAVWAEISKKFCGF